MRWSCLYRIWQTERRFFTRCRMICQLFPCPQNRILVFVTNRTTFHTWLNTHLWLDLEPFWNCRHSFRTFPESYSPLLSACQASPASASRFVRQSSLLVLDVWSDTQSYSYQVRESYRNLHFSSFHNVNQLDIRPIYLFLSRLENDVCTLSHRRDCSELLGKHFQLHCQIVSIQ